MKNRVIVFFAAFSFYTAAIAGPTSGGGMSGVQILISCQKELKNGKFTFFTVFDTSSLTVKRGVLVNGLTNGPQTEFTCNRVPPQQNTGKNVIFDCKQLHSSEGLLAQVSHGYSGALQVQMYRNDIAGQKIALPDLFFGCQQTAAFQ